MSRPILVTGGAGSMGRLVIRELRNAGKSIRAFDLPSADFSPFDSDPEIEVAAGDITSPSDVAATVDGVETLIHLAAILPPLSEANPELTNHVNVEGTRALLEGMGRLSPSARVVFSSSVSVYGRPSQPGRILTADDPMTPDDHYAQSKAVSENVVRESGLDWIALRISGVSVPVFQEPPAEWPFRPDQQIEFVHRDDAVSALISAADPSVPTGQPHIVSGGPSWRMTGARYVEDFFRLVEVDPEDAVYQSDPGHFAWYDTSESQDQLSYQNTAYSEYLDQLSANIEALMAG